MATMAGGPSQLGGVNTKNINSTITDNRNSNNVYMNCTFSYHENYYPKGDQSQQMAHNFQDEGGHQPPRPSDFPSAGRLKEQCVQHNHNRIQAQYSWTGSRCPILPDQSPPTPSQPVATGSSQAPAPTPNSCQSQIRPINDGIVRSRCSTDSRKHIRPQADQKRENNQIRSKEKQRTGEQSKSQLPRCSVSTQTNSAPVTETEVLQSTPTETPDSVRIVDKFGRELKPGDCVVVKPDQCSPVYYCIYVGGLMMVRCDPRTQKVKFERMDTSHTFIRRIPISGRCEIVLAQMRVDRARSWVGRVSPVWETWCGRYFVTWIFTKMNLLQAWEKGFELRLL